MPQTLEHITLQQYSIKWHNFKERMPPNNSEVLCKKPTEPIDKAKWYTVSGNYIQSTRGLRNGICKPRDLIQDWLWASKEDVTLTPPIPTEQTTGKLFEIYTDGNALWGLATESGNFDILMDTKHHQGWYSKEITLLDALVKYGNMALQSQKTLESQVPW